MGSFSNQTGLEIWKNLVFKVHYSFAAYFLPILTLFSLVCNAFVCLIMVKSRGVKARICHPFLSTQIPWYDFENITDFCLANKIQKQACPKLFLP